MIRSECSTFAKKVLFYHVKTVRKEIETQSHYEVKMRRNQHI